MLAFQDPTVRNAASLRHLAASVGNAATVRQELDRAPRGPEERRFLLAGLLQDALGNGSLVAEKPAESAPLTLLRGELEAALTMPGYSLIVADVFEGCSGVTAATLASVVNSAALRLGRKQKIALLVALVHSGGVATRGFAKQVLATVIGADAAEHTELLSVLDSSPDVLQQLLLAVGTDPTFAAFNARVAADGVGFVAPKDTGDASIAGIAAAAAASASLAGVLAELGPSAIASPADASRFIQLFPAEAMTPAAVADCLAFMVNVPAMTASVKAAGGAWTSLKTAYDAAAPGKTKKDDKAAKDAAASGDAFNLPNFVGAVKEKDPSLDWLAVLMAVGDSAYLGSLDAREKLPLLLGAYKKATGQSPPLKACLPLWPRNPGAQLQLLRFLVANHELVDKADGAAGPQGKLPDELVTALKPGADFSPLWRHPGFVATLIDIAALKGLAEVAPMIAAAGKASPGGLVAALCCSRPQRGTTAVKHILAQLVERGPAACLPDAVVQYVKAQNSTAVLVAALSRYAAAEHGRVGSILATLQRHALFEQFLRVTSDPHVYVLVAISGQESGEVAPNLLTDAIARRGAAAAATQGGGSWALALAAAAVEVCDDLLKKTAGDSAPSGPIRSALCAVADVADVSRLLPRTVQFAEALLARGSDIRTGGTSPPPAPVGGFPKAVEKQATAFLEALLKQSRDATGAIEKCKALNASGDAEKQQLLNCIAHTAVQESKMVASYPQRDLAVFAAFFGGLVDEGLMNQRDLANALRIVHSAVAQPQDARTLEFGITSITTFKKRVPQWPTFAAQLRAVSEIDMKIPGIVAVLDRAAREAAEADKRKGAEAKDSAGGGAVDVSATLGLHTFDIRTIASGSQHAAPSSVVQDRINFVVGNTDPSNIDASAQELQNLVQPAHYAHFSEYIVVKRLALEPNNHKMYLALIDRIESPGLEAALRKATIAACRRLLESDKIRTNSSERTLLKNLGSFLGQISLARNIPINASDLDLRDLVPKGLAEGKLIATVPFLAKILEHSAQSRAFRVPCPWVMGLLAQLVEMYSLPDLKITLRFEVEVLCRNIGLPIADVVEAVKDRQLPPGRRSLSELKAQHVDVGDSPDFRVSVEEPAAPPQPGPSRLAPDAEPYQPRTGGGPGMMPHGYGGIHSNPHVPEARSGDEIQFVPQLHRQGYRLLLQQTVERVIQDLMPALERSVTISCTTTREIVVKDFIADPDEMKLRRAGQAMSRSLAANLVAVTARDLLPTMLRKLLSQALPQAIPPEVLTTDILDQLVHINVEPCTAALDAITADSAAKVIDDMLAPVVEERRKAQRSNDFPVVPPDMHRPSVQAVLHSLPEPLRPRPLGPTQLQIYSDFAALVPRSTDTSVEQVIGLMQIIEEAAHRHYQQVPPTTPQQVLSLTNVAFTETTQSEHHNLIKQKLIEVSHLITEANAVPLLSAIFPRIVTLAEKVQGEVRTVGNHLHCVNLLLNEVCLFVLQAVREKGQGRAVSELTRMYLSHERRWHNKDLATNLVRLRVVDISEFDRLLTQALEADRSNRVAVEFAGHIVQKCLIDDKLATLKDLKHTLDILEKIAVQSKRNRSQPTSVRIPSQHGPEHRAQVEALFREWIGICEKSAKSTGEDRQQVALQFVQKLQTTGMLKVEVMLDKFFGLLMEISVEDFATQAMFMEREGHRGNHGPTPPEGTRVQCPPPPSRLPQEPKLFVSVDAYTELVVVLVKCCSWSRRPDDESQRAKQSHAEVALVTKVLSVVAKALQHNHDHFAQPTPPAFEVPDGCVPQESHMQQPFFRFFSNLLISLAPTQTEEMVGTAADVFPVLANTFHAINPQRLPGFAFAWIELVCHRVFVAKMLKHTHGWPAYFKLMNDALRFVDPFARASEMTPALSLFFKCLLKIMLLLLHDFPEFLLAYHQPLCDAIPLCCVQLRNVVLSAFPRNTKLPDPFSTSLRIEQLPEVQHPPTLVATVKDPFSTTSSGQPCPLDKSEFDKYIATKHPRDFPSSVAEKLRAPGGGRYNIPLLNGVVLYTCIAGFDAHPVPDGQSPVFDPNSPAVEMLMELFLGFDSEGRYYLVNACANQLRFPNSHTWFFSTLLLHVFMHRSPLQEMIQEVVTRVLAERLIITRPHPWGLLITFIEIVKNPKYQFWEKPFIRCTPDIERMFESVGQSVASSGAAKAAAT